MARWVDMREDEDMSQITSSEAEGRASNREGTMECMHGEHTLTSAQTTVILERI